MKNKIVFIGYSGHSYGCIELAINQGLKVEGYFDLKEKKINPYNLKFLGIDSHIKKSHHPFISIGHNLARRKIYEKLNNDKIFLELSLIHSNSIISNSSVIKNQTYVSAGVIINPMVNIGKGCIINTGAILEHESKIGDFTHICPGAVLAGNVTIGKNCMIGANSTIKEGVKIGNNVTVGAGSVIISDIINDKIIVGNPGRVLKK
tara:strand:- start:162 stop:776 length:615 start_codon:yes stop_codon:yes gene_type:complete